MADIKAGAADVRSAECSRNKKTPCGTAIPTRAISKNIRVKYSMRKGEVSSEEV